MLAGNWLVLIVPFLDCRPGLKARPLHHSGLLAWTYKKIHLPFFIYLPDRYRNLPDVYHQEQFLDVQLFLLESFISRLTLEAEETSFAPAGLHYCSVLNSANYINLILQEWSEQMVQYWKGNPHLMNLYRFNKQPDLGCATSHLTCRETLTLLFFSIRRLHRFRIN